MKLFKTIFIIRKYSTICVTGIWKNTTNFNKIIKIEEKVNRNAIKLMLIHSKNCIIKLDLLVNSK